MFWHVACDISLDCGHGYAAGRPDRSWRNVMGIFDALTTAVGGLRAQSFALENISGNIANSQTTAFKRIDTSFLDLVPARPRDRTARRRRRPRSHAPPTGAGRRAAAVGRHLYGDQRRRLLLRAEARQLRRRRAGVRRRRPLHPPRRFPAQQERLSRQRCRLLSDGRADRSDHRQSDRQLAAGSEIPERLPAGAGDDQDRLSRQPRELSADDRADTSAAGSELLAPGSLQRRL